jgi:ABC-type lipoprotein export system ATPase subunit
MLYKTPLEVCRVDIGINPSLIKVSALQKSYQLKSGPDRVLQNVNFEIPENSFSIIFGPSGSGKTTLLNILSGMEPPTRGSVSIAGQELYQLDADQRAHFRSQQMGLIHQVDYWVKSLNVIENVALPLLLTGQSKPTALAAAKTSLEQVGMAEFANYQPAVLSGGEQQRVSVARALVNRPRLILADEPTGNLDSKNGQMIIDLLLKVWLELGSTIVLITHNIEYLPLSTQQLFIRDGKLTVHNGLYRMPKNILRAVMSSMDEQEPVS